MTAPLPDLPARLRLCHGVLVDSNILIDIASADAHWESWSADALAQCLELAPLVINPVIYAEVSTGYRSIEVLDDLLPPSLYRRQHLPWEAGFLAGKAYLAYKRRGGTRTSPLPDFYIGAHAAVTRLALLTRDAARYRSYFPTVDLLAPDHR